MAFWDLALPCVWCLQALLGPTFHLHHPRYWRSGHQPCPIAMGPDPKTLLLSRPWEKRTFCSILYLEVVPLPRRGCCSLGWGFYLLLPVLCVGSLAGNCHPEEYMGACLPFMEQHCSDDTAYITQKFTGGRWRWLGTEESCFSSSDLRAKS